MRLDAQAFEMQLGRAVHQHQRARDQYGGDRLRDDSRQGYARHAHLESYDKNEIQSGIDDARNRQKVEWTLGVANGAQNGGAEVIEHLNLHADKDDAGIQFGKVNDVLGRTHDFQQRARGNQSNHRQHAAADDGEQNGGMNGFGNARVVRCTGITCNQHVDADGKADEQADNHVVQRADRADSRQRLVAREAADHDGIRRVEEKLQNAGQHDRQRKKQHLGQKGAFRHIHGAVCV